MTSDEGYLILATGPRRYLDMARNLAVSLRVMDGTRPVCLAHDEQADLGEFGAAFDHFALLPDHPLYPGFMNKIRLHGAAPYRRTMVIDADCLMVKRDIDAYWATARETFFAITGGRRTAGEWKGADIAALLRQEGAPYLVQMNSGVFSFDDSPDALSFFAGLNDFYLRRRDALGVGLHRGKPAQTDEIYIGLWMGLNGIDARFQNSGENSLMVSTWRAFGLRVDPERGVAVLRKPRRSIAGVPNPIMGWDRLSPTILHFIGLRPRGAYQRLSRWFQARVGVVR
jgi:hypothetical protein